jgi:hypothetical protein
MKIEIIVAKEQEEMSDEEVIKAVDTLVAAEDIKNNPALLAKCKEMMEGKASKKPKSIDDLRKMAKEPIDEKSDQDDSE